MRSVNDSTNCGIGRSPGCCRSAVVGVSPLERGAEITLGVGEQHTRGVGEQEEGGRELVNQ